MNHYKKKAEQLERELAGWMQTAAQFDRNAHYYRANQLALQRGIRCALNELGVPTPNYPAPVANAVEALTAVLDDVGIVDGIAVHADDCPGAHNCKGCGK